MVSMKEVTGARETSGSPPGSEEWTAQTKAIDRVIEIALTLDQPRTAAWVAEEAAVAEQTARDHLASLTTLGVVATTEARGVTKYQLDRAYRRFTAVAQYVEQFDRDTLMDRIATTQDQIATTKTRYGVETPAELRLRATEADTSGETVREYKQAAAEWETLVHRLDVLEEALERYDEFSRERAIA
ncbi:transcriptional regulator [Halodesulfurarchaeum formicicum]|uniref:Transcriptional regulator n=2 Tax=Halobacteriaceae TaxID=2236 RepID=A0A1J1ADS8_9EURY|nr:transcriptional regulator [Halodesulfurarchaeum formicicum]